MGIELMNRVWPLDIPSPQKFTLLVLADRADDSSGVCYPSVRWVMSRTNLSERTVQRAIVWLAEEGHLTVKEKPGQSSDYVVHPRQADTPTPVTESPPSQSHPRQADATPPSQWHTPPVRLTGDPRHSDTLSPSYPPCDPEGIPESRSALDTPPSERRGSHPSDNGRATRIPRDFALTEPRRSIAESEQIDPDRTYAKFVDYWRAASGARAKKLDWDATWRNWCRSEADRNKSGSSNNKPRKTRYEELGGT